MSMVLTRSPLEPIGMNGVGAQKRRSARLSQDGAEENEPPAKKSKVNSAQTTTVGTKEKDGDANGTARSKRKVYDDDGFSFTKGSRAKRSKEPKQPTVRNSTAERQSPARSKQPEPAVQPAPISTASATPAPPTTQKKTRKRFPTTPEREEAEKPVRRSKRLSDENPHVQPQRSPQRPSHAKSHANADRSPSPEKARPLTVEKKRKHGPNGMEEEQKIMRIQLPFQDTPVIRRNRDMRKSSGEAMNRRTSSGMRGRRISSMIDEGRGNGKQQEAVFFSESMIPFDFASPPAETTDPSSSAVVQSEVLEQPSDSKHESPMPATSATIPAIAQSQPSCNIKIEPSADDPLSGIAMPHSEVPASEFYKHIAADIPEPRRMRCLLGWCGHRSLPPKPEAPKDSTPASNLEFQALQTARVIQDELFHQLSTDGMLSDWFSRDEAAPTQVPLVKKANPRNLINAAKAEELERELERLKKEREEWDKLIESVVPQSPTPKPAEEQETHLSPVQSDLLDDSQRQILEQLQASTGESSTNPTAIQQRLNRISEGLEFAVDEFANGIHTLNQTRETADRLADRTLSETVTILEERAKARSGRFDGMDALKALGKMMNPRRS